MKTILKPTEIYDAKKRVLATAPPVVKAVLNGTYKPVIKKPGKLKRVKRCGCWQSESNVQNNHQAYSRKCRKHKLVDAITGTITDYKICGFVDLWRFKSIIKHELLGG